MAQNDVKSNLAVVAAGASMDIQPPSTEEWTVHNIKYTGAVAFKEVRGADVLQFETDGNTAGGAKSGLMEHVTNAQFIRITNTGGSSITISYQAIARK